MAKSLRDAYGESLLKHGGEDSRVVVLDADLSSSTKSGIFGKAYPERFFNVGIAESNMVGMAAGLSTTGKIPFINTFAVFMTTLGLIGARGLCSYGNMNVKFMGAYGGMSGAYDGPSHHAMEDIATMRVLPNFTVLVASDEYQVDWLVREAIRHEGPMYIRLSREACTAGYNENTKFEIGKGHVAVEGTDATIIACGVLVQKAIEAAELLKAEGISVRVVDMFSIKPIDGALVKKCADETGAIVTAEEHNVIGGLYSAVMEAMGREGACCPVEPVAMYDAHTETGAYKDLLQKYGFTAENLADKVKKAIARKK